MTPIRKLYKFNRVVKKVHMYLALLNFSILFVFGIAGLKASFSRPGSSEPATPVLSVESFTVPASVINDRDLVLQIRERLGFAAGGMNSRRNAENHLEINYYTPNGPRRVTVMEKENELRISTRTENIWHFFDNLHATANRSPLDWRLKLWSYYNEMSVWSLIIMALTGVYLWLCTRPQYVWAQVSFAVGTVATLAVYWIGR